MSAKPAYTELTQIHLRLYRYDHLAAIVGWDHGAVGISRCLGKMLHRLAEVGFTGSCSIFRRCVFVERR